MTETPADPVSQGPDGVEITVWAVPRSKRDGVAGVHGDALRIRTAQPAEKGKANAAIARLLEDRLSTAVELISGQTGRRKRFRVVGLSADAVRRRLGV